MKTITKAISMILAALLLTSSLTAAVFAGEPAKEIILQIGNPIMAVDGEAVPIDEEGTAPVIQGGRTLLPIRALIEALGGTVAWDADKRQAAVELNGTKIEMTVGSKTVTVNGTERETDVAPCIVNGRTMLPLRFVAENLGCGAEWDAREKSVTVTKDGGLWPTVGFRTSTPEEQGLDPAGIAALLEKIGGEDMDINSILIMKNGFLVFEGYFGETDETSVKHIWSCTKSILGLLVGIAIDEGYIESAQKIVIDYYPDVFIEEENPNWASKRDITIEQLLTLTSGIMGDWMTDEVLGGEDIEDTGLFVFGLPQSVKAGDKYRYDSMVLQILSNILVKTTGCSVLEYAEAKLFRPIGITSAEWRTDVTGVHLGGYGISMNGRDMMRIGYLFQNRGKWGGTQIVSEGWFAKTVTVHPVPNDPEYAGNYGYLMVILPDGIGYGTGGAYGQQILTDPGHGLTVTVSANKDHESLFEFLLPYIMEDEG